MSVNNHTYTKKVWLDHQVATAAVYRNNVEIGWKWWVLIITTLKNQERAIKKAHKWADNLIDLCKRHETPNA